MRDWENRPYHYGPCTIVGHPEGITRGHLWGTMTGDGGIFRVDGTNGVKFDDGITPPFTVDWSTGKVSFKSPDGYHWEVVRGTVTGTNPRQNSVQPDEVLSEKPFWRLQR